MIAISAGSGFPTVAQDGRPPIEPGSLMPWMAYSPPRQWGDRRDESVGRATYPGKRRETRAGISGSSLKNGYRYRNDGSRFQPAIKLFAFSIVADTACPQFIANWI